MFEIPGCFPSILRTTRREHTDYQWKAGFSLLPFVDRLWLFKTKVCLQVADAHPALNTKTDDVLSSRNRINDRKLLHVHGNRLHLKSFPKREYFRILEEASKSKSKLDFAKKLSHRRSNRESRIQ